MKRGKERWGVVVRLTLACTCLVWSAAASAVYNYPPTYRGVFPTKTYAEGSTVSFTVPAFTDREGLPLTYMATGMPNWLHFNGPTRTFSGWVPFSVTTSTTKSFAIRVSATDVGGKKGYESFYLKITNATPRPLTLAVPIPDQQATEDSFYYFTLPPATFSYQNGASLTYTFSGLPAEIVSYDGSSFAFLPKQAHVGTIPVTITVRDQFGGSKSDTFNITVANVNDAPVATNYGFAAFGAVEDQPFSYTLPLSAFYDEDGDALTYALVPGCVSVGVPCSFNAATRTVTGVAKQPIGPSTDPSPWRLQIAARDPFGASATINIDMNVTPVNDPPYLVHASGDLFVYMYQRPTTRYQFADPDNNNLTLTATGLPPWLTINESGVLCCEAGLDDSGSWFVTVTATDPSGLSASDSFQITVAADNHVPEIGRSIFIPKIAVGEALNFTFHPDTFTDPDGEPLTYTISGPAWLSIDSATRTLSGTPAESDAGFNGLIVTATDPRGAHVAQGVSIEVVGTPTDPPTTYTISGQIRSQASAVVDSDTNDPDGIRVRNDQSDAAQAIGIFPALISGFANSTDELVPGVAWYHSDPIDTFRMDLHDGDVVTLQISDHLGTPNSEVDLDLYLEDPVTLEVKAFSIGVGPSEQVIAPSAGAYNLVVVAFNGRSNYLLSVTPAVDTQLIDVVNERSEFVTDEAVVRYRDASVARKRGERVGAPQLLHLDTAPAGAIAKPGADATGTWRGRYIADRALREKLSTALKAKLIGLEPGVASVDLNFIRHATALPNDPLFPAQWNYQQISLPQAWSITTGDAGVTVAVIDTGVVLAHPDLAANLVAGYDFISSAARALDGDGIDANPDDPGDQALTGASSFHGTHVAGTIGAVTNNGIGVAGVSWNSKLMPLRVLGKGGGTSYDVMQAVRYAAGLDNDSGTYPAKPADVINLSLGGSGSSTAEQEVFAEARAAGVIIVAAAGNQASALPSYPAAYQGVIGVAATDQQRNATWYSNYGSTVDVAAPGGDMSADLDGNGVSDGVLSTLAAAGAGGQRTPIYQYYQGTSMATPHVAGVIALMRAVYPALSPMQFDNELASGRLTDDLGNDGAVVRNDTFGYGLINAAKAVARAQDLVVAPTPTAVLILDTGIIWMPFSVDSGIVHISSSGDPTTHITGVVTSSPALSVTPFGVDANGFGSYTVHVDRTGLAAGQYSFRATFQSDHAGSADLIVSVRVAPPPITVSDNGLHHVLLVDTETFETKAEVTVSAVDGVYTYTLEDLLPGEYFVVAGSDHDGDHSICDAGESCGAYSSLLTLVPVLVIDGDVELPAFDTAVQQAIGTNLLSPAILGRTPTGFLRMPVPAPSAPVATPPVVAPTAPAPSTPITRVPTPPQQPARTSSSRQN